MADPLTLGEFREMTAGLPDETIVWVLDPDGLGGAPAEEVAIRREPEPVIVEILR